LVPTVENKYLKRGELYHEFAEFYLCYPDLVREKSIGFFVDIIVDELGDFVDELDNYRLITQSRVALANIIQYLDGIEAEVDINDLLAQNSGRETENYFGEIFDLPVSSPRSEVWFENENLGIKGKIDLVQGTNHLLDFKSGSRNSAHSVVQRANIHLLEDDVNFQVILYLSHFRSRHPNHKLKFTFFHFLDNVTDAVRGEGNLADTITRITYYPRQFSEQVCRQETFDKLIAGVSENNKRRKTLEGLGYQAYRSFFSKHSFPRVFEKEELLEEEAITGQFVDYARDNFKDVKYVRRGCRSALKKLIDFRRTNFFSEDIDLFEEFVRERLEELNSYRRSDFPIEGWLEDFDLENSDYRDLIRDDR
ncbi:MAG: PD-(D/E)XK nuclease family protein, partial [bacterium]